MPRSPPTARVMQFPLLAPKQSTFLDAIFTKMDRSAKRRLPSSYLLEFSTNDEEDFLPVGANRRTVRQSLAPFECTGCRQTDRSKLRLADDKSGMVCERCGALQQTNFQETAYESAQRTSTVNEDSMLCPELTSDEFCNAKDRKRARSSHTKLPQKYSSAQELALKTSEQTTYTLEARARKRVDKCIVSIHTTFRSCGFDPDSHLLCKASTELASRLFLKANDHMTTCQASGRGCALSLLRFADPKLISKACIHHILTKGKDVTAKGETFEGLTAIDLSGAETKLNVELAPFLQNRGVVVASNQSITKVLTSTDEELCKPCEEELDEADVPLPEPHTTQPSNVDEFIAQLMISLESAKQIGWIDESMLDLARVDVVSANMYSWILEVASWPPDVVCCLICQKILLKRKLSTATIRRYIDKGNLKASKETGRILIKRSRVDEWLNG